MDLNKAMTLYMECKRRTELLDASIATEKADLTGKMKLLSQFIEAKATELGLKNVPISGVGTGYWKTMTSAKVDNRTAFRDYVIKNDLWDLMEIRAAAKQVADRIKAANEVPAGVTFSQVRVFQIKSPAEAAKEVTE